MWIVGFYSIFCYCFLLTTMHGMRFICMDWRYDVVMVKTSIPSSPVFLFDIGLHSLDDSMLMNQFVNYNTKSLYIFFSEMFIISLYCLCLRPCRSARGDNCSSRIHIFRREATRWPEIGSHLGDHTTYDSTVLTASLLCAIPISPRSRYSP